MSTTQLPQEISTDGRDVWDWAASVGDAMARIHRSREVWKAIVDGESQCGSCSKWMTGACPQERQDNRLGCKVGPSCQAIKCDQFAINAYDRRRIDGLRAEHASLNAKDTQ
jgi:hypothetical protein